MEDKKEFISNELHSKLCNELSEIDFRGTLRYSGFVEPLLDKNIYFYTKIVCVLSGPTETILIFTFKLSSRKLI